MFRFPPSTALRYDKWSVFVEPASIIWTGATLLGGGPLRDHSFHVEHCRFSDRVFCLGLGQCYERSEIMGVLSEVVVVYERKMNYGIDLVYFGHGKTRYC